MTSDALANRDTVAPHAVWVFHGENARFSSGVFNDEQQALAWIARHRLTGVLTEYPVGEGCYDTAVADGQFRATKPHHGTPSHVARFSPAATQHRHVRDGHLDLWDRPGPDMDADPPHDRPLWLIEIAVLASRDEVDRLTDDLITMICPDPDHDGDCPTPWTLTTIDGTSFSPRRQAELREVVRLTNPDPDDFQ